jgi:hypothetical protein
MCNFHWLLFLTMVIRLLILFFCLWFAVSAINQPNKNNQNKTEKVNRENKHTAQQFLATEFGTPYTVPRDGGIYGVRDCDAFNFRGFSVLSFALAAAG